MPIPPPTRDLIACALAYLALAAALMGGARFDPRISTVGFPTIDSLDTITLRGLVPAALLQGGHSDGVFAPVGFPVTLLTPNLVDHLSAAPLTALLPFPLSDAVWWWLVLAANGLAAHHLGRTVGGGHAAGALTGVAFATSEAVLREANLHHAPQAMAFAAPMALAALWRLRASPSPRGAVALGLWTALLAQTYWYYGLFLILSFAALLPWRSPRAVALAAWVTALGCAPTLLPQLWGWSERPLTAGMSLAPPRGVDPSFSALSDHLQFVAWHGADWRFPLRSGPADLSNRLPLSLLVAAVVALIAPRAPLPRGAGLALLAAAAGAGLMVLGPALRSGDALVLWDGAPISLPFAWLGDLHPALARLTWPERWGIIVPLALAALAAAGPRPGLFAGLVLAENLALSSNLPLQHQRWAPQACWAALPPGGSAVLELPLDRHGGGASAATAHARLHRRPVVNPLALPPSVPAPAAWEAWRVEAELMRWIDRVERGEDPGDPGAAAVRQLRDAGVGVIAVDLDPSDPRLESRRRRLRAVLGKHLGPPIDLGCAAVWWLDLDVPAPPPHPAPEAWRAEAEAGLRATPRPSLDTLIEVRWSPLQPSAGGEP